MALTPNFGWTYPDLGENPYYANFAIFAAAIDSEVYNHEQDTTPHGAVSAATPSKLVIRDAAGRTQVADPAADGDAATKKYVDDIVSPSSTPTGGIILWTTETAPTGYLECAGQSLAIATYTNLYAVLGVKYGNVDGAHFNLPDLRGVFVRGWDHAKGIDPDAATRTNRGDLTTGDHVGTKQADDLDAHTHDVVNGTTGAGAASGVVLDGAGGTAPAMIVTASTGGNETRPININLMYVIKT